MSISIIIWSNISRQQYLQGLTDKQLCEILGVTSGASTPESTILDIVAALSRG